VTVKYLSQNYKYGYIYLGINHVRTYRAQYAFGFGECEEVFVQFAKWTAFAGALLEYDDGERRREW
jgi:hypothetical protein